MKKIEVTQQQYMKIFYTYGMICFSLVATANIYDLIRKWGMEGFALINKVSSIATVIFFFMLVGMFWFNLRGIKQTQQLPTHNMSDKEIEELLSGKDEYE